ncbi:hypothetical protein BC833DRAFT_608424 [Globomyces pollinis-pini]|nr:hypothetical protein BC833DRAFT_608424 [Globomyces pollinis-pini]
MLKNILLILLVDKSVCLNVSNILGKSKLPYGFEITTSQSDINSIGCIRSLMESQKILDQNCKNTCASDCINAYQKLKIDYTEPCRYQKIGADIGFGDQLTFEENIHNSELSARLKCPSDEFGSCFTQYIDTLTLDQSDFTALTTTLISNACSCAQKMENLIVKFNRKLGKNYTTEFNKITEHWGSLCDAFHGVILETYDPPAAIINVSHATSFASSISTFLMSFYFLFV